MAEKRRYTVSLPEHVADRVETYAKTLSATPTEYVADIVRWWFGQGCPAVTKDEQRVRGQIDVWNLDPLAVYTLTDDNVVEDIMRQLRVPNLFARIKSTTQHTFVAFDNHPSHWVILHLWKGMPKADQNGLLFDAIPKRTTPHAVMLEKLQREAAEIGTNKVVFSQIPNE